MDSFIDSFINALSHSSWPCLAIAVLVFIESSPLLGLFVPGVLLIPAIGSLSGQGLLNFWQVFFCAFGGAMAIDSIGYWLGRKGNKHWQQRFAQPSAQQLQLHIQNLFHRYGVFALFLARIMFLIHPMVPITAGILGINFIIFYLIDTLAVMLWLLLYLSGGHWITIGWQHINSEQQVWITIALALITIALLIRRWFLHRSQG